MFAFAGGAIAALCTGIVSLLGYLSIYIGIVADGIIKSAIKASNLAR